MKRQQTLTHWWRARGLLERLLFPLILVFALGTAADMQFSVARDSAQQNEENARIAEEILSTLAPLIVDAAIIGDYASLLQTLRNASAARPSVERLEWIPPNGRPVSAHTTTVVDPPPAWFRRWITIHAYERTQALSAGGSDYGLLRARITAGPAEAQLWRAFRDHLARVAITLSIIIASVVLILRNNLKALLTLSKSVERFTAGQHDVRVKLGGAREIGAVSDAFNQMADQIGTLVGDLSRHQASLSNQLRFTRQLISMLPSPFYYTDSVGRVTGVNAAWENFFGITQIDAFGKASSELWEQRLGAESTTCRDAALLQRGDTWLGEATLTQPDGSTRYILIAKAAFRQPDGTVAGILGTITDVTEARTASARAQQAYLEKTSAEAANQAKSAFLANMSHEIRTPLTAIIGFSESLLDPGQTMEERFKSIQTVISSGRHLLQLINAILDLSKIEADKLEVEHIDVDLFALVHDITQLMTLQMQEKALGFYVTPHFPLPARFVSDPVRIKQVVINLLSNAAKFTTRGNVHLALRWLPEQALLEWRVSDTGIGLTREQQAKLFTPFTQADASTTRQFGGTGLGLYVSKRLAEMLGGNITVDSEINKGSTFTFTLRADHVDAGQLLHQAPVPAAAETAANQDAMKRLHGTILLAEDNPHNQELIGMYLRKLGVRYTLAENGLCAVELASQQQFDLVLMDMQMPVLDGWEAVLQLRARGFAKPIIALTANAMRSDIDRCMALGCSGFLAKPIDRRLFADTLAQHLPQQSKDTTEPAPLFSSLLENEPELEDLVEKFVAELPNLADTVVNLAQVQDWPALKHRVHDLKGISGSYGYPLLSQLAAKIEFELLKDGRDNLTLLLQELVVSVQRVQDGWRQRATGTDSPT